jgi:hypothetical protein
MAILNNFENDIPGRIWTEAPIRGVRLFSDKAMAILNNFVNDTFKCIATFKQVGSSLTRQWPFQRISTVAQFQEVDSSDEVAILHILV